MWPDTGHIDTSAHGETQPTPQRELPRPGQEPGEAMMTCPRLSIDV